MRGIFMGRVIFFKLRSTIVTITYTQSNKKIIFFLIFLK